MNYKVITYKTLTGEKKIVEFERKVSGKWIIYENKEPAYELDCFDLKSKTGLLLNDLLFSEKKTIKQVLKQINTKFHKKLTVEKPPLFEIIKEEKVQKIELETIPHEWLE